MRCQNQVFSTRWRLSQESNIPQQESRIHLRPCIVQRHGVYQSRKDFQDNLDGILIWFHENVLCRTECVKLTVSFHKNVLDGTKYKSLSRPRLSITCWRVLSGCAIFSALSACIIHLADILAFVRTEILLESDQGCTDFRRCHDADEMSGENPALEHH